MKHSYELMKVEQQGKLVAVYLIYIFIWLMKSLYCDEIAVWALQLITVCQHAVKSSVGTLIKHRHRLQDQLVKPYSELQDKNAGKYSNGLSLI